MRAVLVALATLLSLQVFAAESLPPVSAVLTQESLRHRADGVTETFVFQERFLRVGDDAWLERVLPKDTVVVPPQPGEHGPNLQTLPRWMRAGEQGKATLTLVDRDEKFVVAIKPPEFGRLGFGGNWVTERSLIDPASVKTMKPLARASSVKDARWFEARADGRYSRVLWNERLQLPLRIETGTDDGHQRSVTEVKLDAMPKTLPWTGLDGWRVREVDDFGD